MLIIYFFLVCSTSSLLTRKTKVLYNILPMKQILGHSIRVHTLKMPFLYDPFNIICTVMAATISTFFTYVSVYVKTLYLLVKPPKSVANNCCTINSLHTQHNITMQPYNIDKIVIFILTP
jgi:hypothetical protein